MTHARLAEIEAAIARDEATNPDAYYEYQGTIDEAHTRRQLATSDVLNDRAFLAPDGKWVTEHSDPTPQPCARCWANPDTDVDEIPVSRIPAAAHRGPREFDTTCPECWGTGCIACQWTGSTDVSQSEDLTLPTGGSAVNYGAAGI